MLFARGDNRDFDTPGQLAQELASHKRKYEQGIKNIIERGTAKVAQLGDLERATRNERIEHERLLEGAKP